MYAFLGGFHAQKCLLSGLCPGDRLLSKKSTFVFGFQPQFLALGGQFAFCDSNF